MGRVIFDEMFILTFVFHFFDCRYRNFDHTPSLIPAHKQPIECEIRTIVEGEKTLNRRFTVEVFYFCLQRKFQVGFQVGVIGSQRFPGHIGKRFPLLDTKYLSHPSFLFIPGHVVALLQSTHSGVKIDPERHGQCRCDACCRSFYAAYSSSATATALINAKVNRQSCTASWCPCTSMPCCIQAVERLCGLS